MVNLDLLFPANHLRGETTILSSKVFNHAPTNYMYYWLLYCFYTLTLKHINRTVLHSELLTT